MDTEKRKATLKSLLESAVAAVDPEMLTTRALASDRGEPATLIAIGKAAAGMCRGAARVLADIDGVCVTDAMHPVPHHIDLWVGDHPIPGERSLEAGRRVLQVAASTRRRIIALISGGGSALCEHPIDGVSSELISIVNETLLESGASIEETNLVRRHLSAIKNGGLARAARAPIDTYLLSDVCGADPGVIASGPTIYQGRDPEAVIAVLDARGVDLPAAARSAIVRDSAAPPTDGLVTVIADGRTAVDGLVEAATAGGVSARAADYWLDGDLSAVLDRFLQMAGSGLTVAAGEPEVAVTGDGRGGRNTHAALLAARSIAGTGAVFAALATDGVDGSSGSAGAIVDGESVSRGGDPTSALDRSDSATYLTKTGDLLAGEPTGTNVSDIWVLWR